MSNGLAIAAVTRVLQDLLQNGLAAAGIDGAVGGSITVSALPPDRILGENGEAEATQLNLFLHQITPNAAWRNADLPTRDGGFERVADSLLGLNLHYLLTAYTAAEFQGEILLGHAMQVLHDNAVLSRSYIRGVLDNPPGGAMAGPTLQALIGSDLPEQLELIRIWPQLLSTDDISRLWTAFQSHYRTTTAYEVAVVLLERKRRKLTPLPVLTRGAPVPGTGRDEGVAVRPSVLPPVPTLLRIGPPGDQPAARMGDLLQLIGHHLGTEQVQVRFVELPGDQVLTLTPVETSDEGLTVQLPLPPPPAPPPPPSPLNEASWRVGLYRVGVMVGPAGGPLRGTNDLGVLLAPRISAISTASAGGTQTFSLTCTPPVRRSQSAALIVGTRELVLDPPLAVDQATQLNFTATGFAPGTYPVRLRVGGHDSLLIDRAQRPPVFVDQVVVVP